MGQEWTPNQRRVITELLDRDQDLVPRPTASAISEEEIEGLREQLETGLAPMADGLGNSSLVITKYSLSAVFKCEGLWLAPDDFAWTVAKARGTVIHKALQISMTGAWRDAQPMELVEGAIAGLRSADDSISEFLLECGPAEMSDLESGCTAAVAAFASDFPALRPSMTPRIEAPVTVELCARRIILKGRYDLALGNPSGDPIVILDLKTGGRYPEHADEMRYYALLETLRQRSAPHRIASYYLDAGEFHAEDVTRDVLASAMARTSEGIKRIAALGQRLRDADLTPGPHCTWCSALPDCQTGERWMSERSQGGWQ